MYGSYDSGDKPKLYGSDTITVWTNHSGNIYKATYNTDITQLFLDDERMQVARYPNTSYHTITSVSSNSVFTSTDIDGGDDYSGALIKIRTEAWSLENKSVVSNSTQTLTINSATFYDVDVGEGFVLMNQLQFLDAAGEWYYDTGTNTVYLWTPVGDTPGNYTVRGSSIADLITISAKDYIVIENLEILQAKEMGINCTNSSYLTIDNCIITDNENQGISLTGGSETDNTITNSVISGSNSNGIYSNGPDNPIIQDNIISDIARFEELGIEGIDIANTGQAIECRGDSALIKYNSITNIGYIGIKYMYGLGGIIGYNFVDSACMVLDDGGGIYSWSSDIGNDGIEGAIISYNIVSNVIGNLDHRLLQDRVKGYGIYMDNNIHDVIIEYNTVLHSGGANIHLHSNGDNIEVKHNTLMDGLDGFFVDDDEGGTRTIDSNIVYAFDENYLENRIERITSWKNGGDASMDYNTYVNHYNSADIFRIGVSEYTFATWKTASSQDANSTIDVSAFTTEEEVLLYNNTKASIDTTIAGTWKYLDGSPVSFPITILSFESIILTE